MKARLRLVDHPDVAIPMQHIIRAAKGIAGTGLPAVTRLLVQIRASQINGCAYCTDMHTKDALIEGEDMTRLNLVATWRDARVFSDAERAALELTEQGTRLADGADGVTDQAWDEAAKHYETNQLAALVMLIAVINAFNRMNVMVRQPAGNYQPHRGQMGCEAGRPPPPQSPVGNDRCEPEPPTSATPARYRTGPAAAPPGGPGGAQEASR